MEGTLIMRDKVAQRAGAHQGYAESLERFIDSVLGVFEDEKYADLLSTPSGRKKLVDSYRVQLESRKEFHSKCLEEIKQGEA